MASFDNAGAYFLRTRALDSWNDRLGPANCGVAWLLGFLTVVAMSDSLFYDIENMPHLCQWQSKSV